MNIGDRWWHVQVALLMVALSVPSSVVLAQPVEVADPDAVAREVAEQVERLVAETALRDPELAREIENQRELCLRDLSDGRLDNEGFVRDIETYREVQREITTEMKTEFDRAYQEALTRGDTAGAEMMRTAFEAFDRGEAFQPTPEMMERMQGEMEQYMSEHPEMQEYAMAEWDRYGQEMAEYAPAEFERMQQEMMERGFEMAHEWEAHAAEWEAHAAEFEHYFEAPERNYDIISDNLADFFGSVVASEPPHVHEDGSAHFHSTGMHIHTDQTVEFHP